MKQLRIRPRSAIYTGFLLVTFTLLATLVHAQTRPGEAPQVQDMIIELQLDSEQQAAVVQIIGEFRDSMDAMMERHGIDPSQGRPPLFKMRAIRSEMQANVATMEQRMAAVLTPEQMQRFMAMQQEQRRNRRVWQ